MHHQYKKLAAYLKDKYRFSDELIEHKVSPHLVSTFQLQIPRKILAQAQAVVEDLHRLTGNTQYQQWIDTQTQGLFKKWPQTPSILCSLDVHVTDDQQIKIIEINTNASSFLVGEAIYQSRGIKSFPNAISDLNDSLQAVLLAHKPTQAIIADESPEQQNLWIEFAMYKKHFEDSLKIKTEIADVKDLTLSAEKKIVHQGKPVDFIYNRHTDFFFQHHKALYDGYLAQQTVISPNPSGYALLADKKRLVEFSSTLLNDIEKSNTQKFTNLKTALLDTKKFSDFASADELWSQRSKYFFKPPQMFGGKSVYRGKSISRTVFQRIYAEDYIAQEFVPASEFKGVYENQEHTFKYDLRFYFFENKIHLALGRLYQGQLTNLQTLLGGLTPIVFID